MKVVRADLKLYNANTRDANVGDCVKRGLSVAYSMDYDEVSRELNAIKRELGVSQYNISPVFERFMRDRGDSFRNLSEDVTLAEFCDDHRSGVYVVLVGKVPGSRTHLAAVVNGDIYDSWDSSNWYVSKYCRVSNVSSEVFNLDSDSVNNAVLEFTESYIDKLNSKLSSDSPMSLSLGKVSRYNKYTYEYYIRCRLGKVPQESRWRSNVTLGHDITVKLNPRLDQDTNIKNLIVKMKQKIYDWSYNIHKELVDAQSAESVQRHRYFHGSKLDLMKFPEWARPLIRAYQDNGSSEYCDRYEMTLQALPEDDRGREDIVSLHADTLRELKWQLEEYRKYFRRPDYDY